MVLGEKKTITWNLTGANPIKLIDSASFYYNGPEWQAEHIKSSIDVTQVSSLDYALRPSAHMVGTGKIKFFVCDIKWNCEWIESEPFTIADPSPARQYPWNTEQVFDLSRTKYPLYRLLTQTFHNPDGSREYVYREYDSASDGTEYIRIMYRKLSGGGVAGPDPARSRSLQGGR